MAIGAYLLGLPGIAALLLWLSVDWRWVEGWVFGVWFVAFIAAGLLWLNYNGSGVVGRAPPPAWQRR